MSSSCLLPFVLWLTKATSVTCRYLLRSWQGTWTGSRTEASPAHREQRRVPGQAGCGRVAEGVVGRECGRFGKYRAAALFVSSFVSVRLRHAPLFLLVLRTTRGRHLRGGTRWHNPSSCHLELYLYRSMCRLLYRERSTSYKDVLNSSGSGDMTDQDRTAVSIPG
jgi:hypothetical protein